MPSSPLAAVALVVLCFALPFTAAALLDADPEPSPVAVQRPAVERIAQGAGTIPASRLARAPRLPALRTVPVPAPAPVSTTPTPTAAPPPTPAPPSGAGRSTGGTPTPESSGGRGSSESFDSTG